jgi:glycosyltransferase involved in cell wall biosynthesis
MKCLVLTSEYPPSKGGVANAAATFSREMAARGWTVEIAAMEVSGQPDLELAPEGTIHRLKVRGDASIWKPLAGEIARFDALVKEFAPDVAVIHGWQGWCVRGVPRLRSVGVPVILQSHGFGMHRMVWNARPPFGLKVWGGYLPFVLKLPSFIRKLHALSVLSKVPRFLTGFDHWIGVKSGCRNVLTIPNGVVKVEGSREVFLATCPAAVGRPIILCVANYCDRKNQLQALEVARQPGMENAFFAFIGGENNTYSRMLAAKIAEWGLNDRVALLHGVSRDFTESAITACAIALMTSKWEMQPLFLLEAMSAGKPWVSTDVGSVQELHGGIISPGDTNALTANVIKLLEDTARGKRLGQQGADQWILEFSPPVVYDRWHKLLVSATQPALLS